jgi:hypothetical protein
MACHKAGTPYDVLWSVRDNSTAATITAHGEIPEAKALPKEPKLKTVETWKPTIFDASYDLESMRDGRGNFVPGHVVYHSSGLRLVRQGSSESGELEAQDGEDVRKDWCVVHSKSGNGFGVCLPFNKAAEALLLAASFDVDWMLPIADLVKLEAAKRANNTVLAKYAKGSLRISAEHRLKVAA